MMRSLDISDQTEAVLIRFADGEFTETVLSASLFALGYRGDELKSLIRDQLEKQHERRLRHPSQHPRR